MNSNAAEVRAQLFLHQVARRLRQSLAAGSCIARTCLGLTTYQRILWARFAEPLLAVELRFGFRLTKAFGGAVGRMLMRVVRRVGLHAGTDFHLLLDHGSVGRRS